MKEFFYICRLKDLNPRPSDYKSDALPTELSRQIFFIQNEYDPCRIRTYDPLIKSQLLYQLS